MAVSWQCSGLAVPGQCHGSVIHRFMYMYVQCYGSAMALLWQSLPKHCHGTAVYTYIFIYVYINTLTHTVSGNGPPLPPLINVGSVCPRARDPWTRSSFPTLKRGGGRGGPIAVYGICQCICIHMYKYICIQCSAMAVLWQCQGMPWQCRYCHSPAMALP